MIIDADVHISSLTDGNRITADEALRRMDRAGVPDMSDATIEFAQHHPALWALGPQT